MTQPFNYKKRKRCKGITYNNTRCRLSVLCDGSDYCLSHSVGKGKYIRERI
jgi:hypothetical protein